MSAECEKHGCDLAFDLSCRECDLEAERDTALAQASRYREALTTLVERVEKEWPRLRRPREGAELNPADSRPAIGRRLRQISEQARTVLDQEPGE